MSFYKNHVFFCNHQRANDEACCENLNSQAMRDYAKDSHRVNGQPVTRLVAG